jgi:tetratricopeptide (TPR) repeat protein
MSATIATIPASPLDAEIERVRALAARGEFAAALAVLIELERRHPASGRVAQERGHYERARGRAPAALAAYERAVMLNDALVESWAALEQLYRSAARLDDAEVAAAWNSRLTKLPLPLMRGSSLLNEGDVDQAEQLIRGYLQAHGGHVEGMRLLAQIGVKTHVLDDAEMLLEHVLTAAPGYHDARYEYASVLLERRRYYPALLQARALLAVQPANRNYLILYASACDGLGECDEALRVYQRLSERSPDDAELKVAMAHVQRACGKTQEAVQNLREAAASPKSFAGACLGLSNLKTYRFADEEIARMRAMEAAPGTPLAERYQLCFALGKALEDRADYAASFGYYERGNVLKRSELNHKPDAVERAMRLQASVCTAEFFAARRGSGCPRPDPIFVVGLPRSGSTLIEQILASHSQVDGTIELPDIPRLVHQFRNRDGSDTPRYPAILAEISPTELSLMGEAYLTETRVFRKGAPYFVDKMPSNFRDIGFIHLILPNAKIIDARREPMACCFGNFKQLFTHGMEFKYSLAEIGRYYCNYVELMDHWDRVLPGKILRVQHEDVVEDLEGSVRRLLEFCGLPFEPACLEFHRTERTVRTVSSEQVRRPIYREGLDQWRNFEPWLGPLKSALAPLKRPT